MSFEFATATRIIFGAGKLREVGAIAAALGTHALVVLERRARAPDALVDPLHEHGVATTALHVARRADDVAGRSAGAARARRERCDLVVALGGGSVIDAGKAIAALITNRAPLRDYLEVVGTRAAARPSARRRSIAIPTTAGTGAEVTRNAVLMAEEERVKVSLRSPLDAAGRRADRSRAHVLAAARRHREHGARRADAVPRAVRVAARESAHRRGRARGDAPRRGRAASRVPRWRRRGRARATCAIASLCGGLALANAKLGAVHGFAAPLGGMFPIPHGVACARLLAPVADANVRALRDAGAARRPRSRATTRRRAILTGRRRARAEDGVAWLRALVEELRRAAARRVRRARGGRRRASSSRRSARAACRGIRSSLTDEELAAALGAAL